MADNDPRNSETPPAEAAAPEATTAPSDAAPETAPLDPSEALAREAADLKDRLLRTLADMENLRRRTEREVVEARSRGVAALAVDLLSVADNMRRALDAVGPDLRASADPGVKTLIEGVELTERELLKAFEKHGMTKLEPQGARFDPNFHQAMYEVPDASVPAGTVVEVVQAGYTLGDRVLRPALVAVAKGGVKPAPAANNGPVASNDNAGGGLGEP